MNFLSTRSEHYGELQELVNSLYARSASGTVSKLDIMVRAELYDLCPELQEVIDLLPSGNYKRYKLCDQLNSIITAHGWGMRYGTVE